MNTGVITELSQVMVQRGYRVPTTTIYTKMLEWVDFYMGEITDFHKFNLKTIDGSNHTVVKPSLNVMKLVCESYSNLIWNEKSKLNVDSKNQEALDKVIENNNLYGELNTFLEKVALYGTGVAIEYTADKETKIGLSYADTMVITDYSNTTPKGVVLIQRVMKGKKYYSHITIHTYKDGIYRVEHEVYESNKKVRLGNKIQTLEPIFTEKESAGLKHIVTVDGNKEIKYYVEYETDTPHFQIFKYSVSNNFDFSPLGISVCANAMGVIKSIDDKFYSSIEDSTNSRKKIFFDDESSKSESRKGYIAETDTVTENYVEYLDRDQTLYKTARLGEEKLQIYAPRYEPQSHVTAIQFDLNLLSLKTGLGKNYFDLNEGGVYINQANVFSSNSELWRNRQANANLFKIFLTNMMKSIMYLENIKNKEYSIKLDDSMVMDDETKKDKSLELVALGMKPEWKHLTEWEGLTEKDAKTQVKESTGISIVKLKTIADAVNLGVMSIEQAQELMYGDNKTPEELELMYIQTLVEKGIPLTPDQLLKYNGGVVTNQAETVENENKEEETNEEVGE